MKVEHNAIIERAKMGGYEPSMIAHELLVHDLVQAALFEFRNVRAPFHSLNEGQRQEVIDRVTEAATKSVYNAISIISSRNVDTIPVTIVDAKFKAKAITVTAAIDAQDPNRHGLIDVAGRLCLLVLAPNDYAEGLDGIHPDRDQPDLPLHVSDMTGNLFASGTGPDEPDNEHPLGNADDLAERTGGVARPDAEPEKEFGEFTYEDAAQLIVLKAPSDGHFEAAWIQSRLAIDSDKTASLLLRLLDNGVIKLEKEGATALEHSYFVVATLEDVT
ncbi:DNA translocase FtsK [Pseudomonas sp.]|uniref:DNA translocase FtsK n=1 Tax=Pseudomonas sp. TaxID=306 RepID=UPI003FD6D2B9